MQRSDLEHSELAGILTKEENERIKDEKERDNGFKLQQQFIYRREREMEKKRGRKGLKLDTLKWLKQNVGR